MIRYPRHHRSGRLGRRLPLLWVLVLAPPVAPTEGGEMGVP